MVRNPHLCLYFSALSCSSALGSENRGLSRDTNEHPYLESGYTLKYIEKLKVIGTENKMKIHEGVGPYRAWTMSGAICAKNAYSIIQQSISWSQNVFQSLISLFSVPTAGMKTNICFYGGPAEAICLLLPLTGPSGTLSLANYVDWTSVRCQSLDCLACTSVEVGTCECSLLPVLKPIVHDFQASARRTNSFQRFDIRNAYATKELSGYPTAIQCTLDAEQSHCPIRERYHAYSTVNDVNNVGTEQKQKSSVIIDNQLTNLVISLARLHGDNKRRGQRGVAGGLLSPMVNFNQRDEYDVYKALK
ncbi:hypothetical protein J6590_053246 [Homalodisca vitripennis]|nr:hypothetical protein J6590_053246 [Homalodisca vitripennis]